MAKPHISTRIDEGFHDEIEEYAEEHDISRAEAMRRLLRNGLDYDNAEELRDAQEELREDMDEMCDVIIPDGGRAITDEVDMLRNELAQLRQYLGGAVVLSTLLYAALLIAVSELIPLLSVVLIPLAPVLVLAYQRVRGAEQ